MPPAASHCGMVSMMMRPARAMMREEAGRGSSMPYISAFSSEGAALMTLGTTRPPSETTAEAWRSRSVARRRDTGMEKVDEVGEGALLESVLRFLAIQASEGWVQVPGLCNERTQQPPGFGCFFSGCGFEGREDCELALNWT
jgi:hypothetical protein